MPHPTEFISLLALGFCALLGLASLFAPKWAAGIVRLTADPDPDKPGGFSEFRATYGGLLLMLHLCAAAIVMQADLKIYYKVFTILPIAAAWMGAGLGRTISLLLDGEENRSAGMIPIWIPMEIALGLAIAAPVLQLIL